jgi:thymidylate synthase (FAD)
MDQVKLVSVTPDAEKLMAYCARVSNPSNQMNTETAPKLLAYLIKHKHWSPMEMVSMCVERDSGGKEPAKVDDNIAQKLMGR